MLVFAIPPDSMANITQKRIDHGNNQPPLWFDQTSSFVQNGLSVRDMVEAGNESNSIKRLVSKRQTRRIFHHQSAPTPIKYLYPDPVAIALDQRVVTRANVQ